MGMGAVSWSGFWLVAGGGGWPAGGAVVAAVVAGGLGGNAVALGIEDDEAPRAFAGAGCLEARVAEEEVEHAALAGVHGREAEGLAGVFDLVDGVVGSVLESAGAGGLEAVGVEGDAVVIFGFEAENLGGEVFEGTEEFAVTGEEEIGVGTFALNVDVAAFETVGIAGSGTCCDAVLEANTTRGGQQPHERGYRFCCLRKIFHEATQPYT